MAIHFDREQGKFIGIDENVLKQLNASYIDKNIDLKEEEKWEYALSNFLVGLYYNEDCNTTRIMIMMDLCKVWNINFEECLDLNINKLKIRFPDKFTEENALNRDLASERKELEK